MTPPPPTAPDPAATPTVADVLAAAEALWPASLAEGWDTVGLVAGDPAAPVHRVLLAVDPVHAVVDEALAVGAELVITHHPLFLDPVHSVAATTAKGRLVHRLLGRGIALFNAHTNADAARGGVSDALAEALGLGPSEPLVPAADDRADAAGRTGVGRVGDLASPLTLARFAERVRDVLPATACGVRVAGDPDASVRRVAVCGGSGGSLLPQARAAGADVFVTSDLRHHAVSESREDGGPALVDVSHAAAESLWLPGAARDLAVRVAGVECLVSARSTDPWSFRA